MTRWRIPEKWVPKVKANNMRISQAKGQRNIFHKEYEPVLMTYMMMSEDNSSDFLFIDNKI